MLIKALTQIGPKASPSAGKTSQHEVGYQRTPNLGLRQSLKSSTSFISTPAKPYQTDLRPLANERNFVFRRLGFP